jgi:hypothetical protein
MSVSSAVELAAFSVAPLAHTEHVLVALRIEAERDEHHVLISDVHPVDHQHDEIDCTEVATEPLGHLRLSRSHEATAHRAPARPTCDDLIGHPFERARVAARRDADEHLLDSARSYSGSSAANVVQLGSSSSRAPRVRARGRRTDIRRPPSTNSLGAVPARYAVRVRRCA